MKVIATNSEGILVSINRDELCAITGLNWSDNEVSQIAEGKKTGYELDVKDLNNKMQVIKGIPQELAKVRKVAQELLDCTDKAIAGAKQLTVLYTKPIKG